MTDETVPERPARPLARQAEVHAAARQLFFERGFRATGTRDIAERLGILGGSLYYYIDSKEELLYEVLREVQAPRAVMLDGYFDGPGDELAKLRRIAAAHVEIVTRDPVGIALTFTELRSLAPERREEIAGGLREYGRRIEDLLRAGQLAGCLDSELEPGPAAIGLLGALNWTHRWYRRDGPLARAHLAEQLADVVVDGLATAGSLPSAAPLATGAADAEDPLPKPSRRGARRRELMAVAAELFSQQGYDTTTTEEITDRLGLHKASFYHYAASKEELLVKVVEDLLGPSTQRLERIAALEVPALARLRAAIDHHVRRLLGEPAQAHLLLEGVRSLSAPRRVALKAAEARYTELLEAVVADGQREGSVRDDVSPGVAARAVLGCVNWIDRLAGDGGPGVLERAADTATAVLLGGVASRTPGDRLPPTSTKR